MPQNVFITGTGRKTGLGYNLVLRYLEQGDTVFATIRKPSEALQELQKSYSDTLHILTVDIGGTASVKAAAAQVIETVSCIDLLINNAVTVSPDYNKEFMDTNLDYIAPAMDVTAIGSLRVIQALMPLLKKSEAALVVNISSEAGSIGACYRTNAFDYSMAKASLNMATKLLHNALADVPNVNVISLHPGWMYTNDGNAKAPLVPYEHAVTLRKLFEERRRDKESPVFITYEGEAYPW